MTRIEPIAQRHTTANRSSADFLPTRWSLVIAAGSQPATPDTQAALEQLAQAYWRPVYAFIRRQTAPASDAEDLTQEFFARLLEKRFLDSADPARGKFRSFLLAAVKHFLCNQRDFVRAQKRGGKLTIVSIPSDAGNMNCFPSRDLTPEQLFARQWALSVLDQTRADLRAVYKAREKLALYDILKDSLTGQKNEVPIATLAAKLGMTAGATKVAIHRLRREYRDILRKQIAQTVCDPAEVEFAQDNCGGGIWFRVGYRGRAFQVDKQRSERAIATRAAFAIKNRGTGSLA